MQFPDIILNKAKNIRLLALDMDGVLTNGQMHLNHEGEALRSFYALDGFGVKLLSKTPIQTAILSATPHTKLTLTRAEEIGIKIIIQPCDNKAQALTELMQKLGLQKEEVAFMGDDWIDLGAMNRSGLRLAVPNAHEDVLKFADYITHKQGGHGAVREVTDLLLLSQGHYAKLLEGYANQ